jgi:uroporphyrinogen decarboxylase
MDMNARERLLAALEGRAPDCVPCALGFSRVDLEAMAPPGTVCDDWIDVQFVRFPLSPEDEALSRLGRPFPYDTRLGTFEQAAAYARWEYHPEAPDRRNPLARARSLDDVSRFPFPDVSTPYHVEGLSDQVQDLHARGLAAGGNLPHLGGELFETAWRLRGLENFLIDLAERPEWACLLLDRLTDMARRNAQTLARAGVDVLFLDDDVGMPGTMMIGPAMWRTFFQPRLARIIAAARAIQPGLFVLFHSDGYFEPIVDGLIEIGVNGINPLQPDHMDALRIRRRYGPRLALWGTVGSQATFSSGSPESIRREVKHRIDSLGRAGLVLSPAYDLGESDIPWRNVAAFLDAARAYG